MKNRQIIRIKSRIVDDSTILDILRSTECKNAGLDMSCVESINSKIFIDSLVKDKFKLFNLNSEMLAYLSLILKGNNLKSYVNKFDFIEEKRELVRRKFLIARNV